MSGEAHIRKVRPDELEDVWRVHVAASHAPPQPPRDAPVASDAGAALASDPDGYFCAVEEGRVGCGFRIGAPTLFMASRPFGRPELYVPSGPILY